MDYATQSLRLHQQLKGKLEVRAKHPITSRDDLATFYTPGIAAVSQAIANDPEKAWEYTSRGNTVAVISDGSAVLGLGNIGPAAAQPVMAGKAVLFKEFADIDAVPIVLATQDSAQIIATVRALAPSFGGINLEDISAPRCFAIEDALQDLGIPVMHDDQHGTAVVVLAALLNACRVVEKNLLQCRIVLNGAGAAGTAIAKMLSSYAQEKSPQTNLDLLLVDSKGIIETSRTDLNSSKQELASFTNPHHLQGGLAEALTDADIFIGISVANSLPAAYLSRMRKKATVFALANPVPEIMPDLAQQAGAAVVATGRSDFPNQVNNVLAFPGIFRGALDAGATRITTGMLLAAAQALASLVPQPSPTAILPDPLNKRVASTIAQAVAQQAKQEKVLRSTVSSSS